MKIMISYQVDTIAEAKAIMEAVDTRGEMTTFRVQDTEEKVVDVFNKCATATTGCIAPVERKNISPGAPSITKIGSKAKEEIMSCLEKDMRPPVMYQEHLKLLWARCEVKFDGQSYYL